MDARQAIDVHFAKASAEDLPRHRAAYLASCDEAEFARFSRFRHDGAAAHFLVGRGLARRVIGAAAGCRDSDVTFAIEPRGRPVVSAPAEAAAWHLSISHSGGIAAVAIGRGGALGLDVQEISSSPDLPGVARKVLTDVELDELSACGAPLSPAWLRRFYALWTAKEAWMKARGAGFSLPPRWCGLQVSSDGEGRRVTMRWCDARADDHPGTWTFSSWVLGDQHAVCVASDRPHLLALHDHA